jgi:hypothetical protein
MAGMTNTALNFPGNALYHTGKDGMAYATVPMAFAITGMDRFVDFVSGRNGAHFAALFNYIILDITRVCRRDSV